MIFYSQMMSRRITPAIEDIHLLDSYQPILDSLSPYLYVMLMSGCLSFAEGQMSANLVLIRRQSKLIA